MSDYKLKFVKLVALVLVIPLFPACHQAAINSGLSITVGNPNPILIPVGAGTTVNGITVTPPYFSMNEISLTWQGPGAISILLIDIAQNMSGAPAGSTPYDCAVDGDNLYSTFPSQATLSNTSQVIILAPTPGSTPVPIGSAPIACSGVPISTPIPSTFNIPLVITVTGGIIPDPTNPNNITGRATATADITLQ